jgi:hypothetical protein
MPVVDLAMQAVDLYGVLALSLIMEEVTDMEI